MINDLMFQMIIEDPATKEENKGTKNGGGGECLKARTTTVGASDPMPLFL